MKYLKCGSLSNLFTLIFYFVACLSCQSVYAQNCHSSADGSVESLIGSDFDRLDTSVVNQNFPTDSILTTTLSGVRIIPDGRPDPPPGAGSYLQTLTYDESLSSGNTYLITDKVYSRWGENEHAILPSGMSDGNSFYVFRPDGHQRGAVMFFFPWHLYRGRSGSLEFRFFIGNLGANEITRKGCFRIGFENGAGGASTYITVKKDAEVVDGEEVCTGSFTDLVSNGGTLLLASDGGRLREELNCGSAGNSYYGWYTLNVDIPSFPDYNNDNYKDLFYTLTTNVYNHDDQDVIFIDYVSMKTEHICIDKGNGCPGETIALSAQHYQEGAEIKWEVNYPKFGSTDENYNNWVPFDTIVYSSSNNKSYYDYQPINGLYPDTVQFRAVVINNMTDNVDQNTSFVVEFAKRLDCVKFPDTLTGLSKADSLICLTKGSGVQPKPQYVLTPYDKMSLGEGMNGYVWSFLDSTGADFISEIGVDTIPSPSGDSLFFELTLPDNLDGAYEFRVTAHDSDPSKQDDPNSTKIVSTMVYAYQTPDVDVVLKDEAGTVLGGQDSVCISKYGKVTIEADSLGYLYSWDGGAFTESHLISYDKPVCGTTRMPVALAVNRIVHPELTCSMSIDTLFKFKNNTEADVVCPVLPSEIELTGEKKDTLVNLPFPTFLSCADSAKITLKASRVLAEGEPSLFLNRSWEKKLAELPSDTSIRLEKGVYKLNLIVEERCFTKSCDVTLTVKDTTMPNCGSYWNAETLFYAYDSCRVDTAKVGFSLPAASWAELSEEEKELVKIKLGISDNSTESLNMTMTRSFAGEEERLDASFREGETRIEWKVVDESQNFCVGHQIITVMDSVPLVCPKETNSVFYVRPEDCSYTFDELLQLGFADSTVTDNCRGDKVAHATRMSVGNEVIDGDFVFNLGRDTIFYTYKIEREPARFIAERNLKCLQSVTLVDTVSPKCGNFWGNNWLYAVENCAVDTSAVALKLGSVTAEGIGATDNCTASGSLSLQLNRTRNGVAVDWNEPYPIGNTIVSWVVTDLSGNTCEDSAIITVLDSLPLTCPKVTNDTFYVEPERNSYEFAEMVALGYKDSTVMDVCRQIPIAHRLREDFSKNAVVDSTVFGLGLDSISYTYLIDADYESFIASRSLTCKRYVTLLDTVLPNFDPSNVRDAEIACHDAMLADWPEITDNSGGSIQVTLDSMSTQSANTADSTYYNYVVTKVWKATDESGNTDSLTQHITVRDLVKPSFLNVPKDTVITCDGVYIHKWPEVQDNCAPVGNISLVLKDSISSQSEDLDACGHYTYSIRKVWLATDPTGNQDTVSYMITVKDSVAPTFEVTKDTITPVYEGKCIYRVPDLSKLVMTNLWDNCTETDNLIYSQIPDSTTLITESTKVFLKLSDPCGNYSLDSIMVFVETSKDAIVSVNMNEFAACSADSVDLTQHVSVSGSVYQTDYYFKDLNSTPVFSTGAWQMAGDSILKSYKATGRYYVIATDTLTGCSDTATAQITVYPQPELPLFVVDPYCANLTNKPSLPLSHGEDSLKVVITWFNDVELKDTVIGAPALSELVAGDYNFYYTATSIHSCLSDSVGRTPVKVYAVPDAPQIDDFSFCLNDKENIPQLPQSGKGDFADLTINWIVNPQSDLSKLSSLDPAYGYEFSVTSKDGCVSVPKSFSVLAMDVPSVSVDYGRDIINVCSGDSLPLAPIKVSVNPMNNKVTSEGWIIGDKIYESLDEIPIDFDGRHFYYFAENVCGRSDTTGENRPVKVDVYHRHKAGDFGLSIVGRGDTAMFFIGEEVSLQLSANEDSIFAPLFYHWYKMNGDYDGEKGFDLDGEVLGNPSSEDDRIYNIDYTEEFPSAYVIQPEDSAAYYVVVGDGVCPPVPTNGVRVDVMSRLPTAFTPYDKEGYNDTFLERHHVMIFDRYGQKVFEGDNGWDGTKSGRMADPGVYFYVAEMKNGVVMKGSIEVVYNR